MEEPKEALVRLRPDRDEKLRQVADILAKQRKRTIIKRPEAIEILADKFLQENV